MDQSYKSRKEAFVSNLSGGSISEINIVTLVASVSSFHLIIRALAAIGADNLSLAKQAGVLLWSALQSRRSLFSPYGISSLVVDFLLNIAAILLATTLYSFSPTLLNIFLATPATFLYFSSKRTQQQQKKAKPPPAVTKVNNGQDTNSAAGVQVPFPHRPFLTAYRGSMMIVTCIAILAVDFAIFPRRFAKAENWGTSLMDLGVGSFVFSGGVVSARPIAKGRVSKSGQPPLLKRLVSSLRHSIPLLMLGLIRLYSVKGLDYAEHVTEYGVHWNFFFTLGFMGPFVEIFHSLTSIIPSYELLSLGISIVYQVLLESTDLKEYILVSPRGPSLLSKNREGVFSFLGYLAIFLAGRGAGLKVIPRETQYSKSPQQARKQLLIRLAAWSAVWSVLFIFNSTYAFGLGASLPVSRRLANMPYILWTVAFNHCQIFLFCLIETVFFPSVHRATDAATEKERSEFATSKIMRAFNRNGLLIFLIANLLTGAVNLGINTLDANKYVAMGVLFGYAAALTGLALGLDSWNIKLRF